MCIDEVLLWCECPRGAGNFEKVKRGATCNKLDEFHYARRLTSNMIIASSSFDVFLRNFINKDNVIMYVSSLANCCINHD